MSHKNVERIVLVYTRLTIEESLMNQTLVTKFPVTDGVLNSLEVTLRGCEELIAETGQIRGDGRPIAHQVGA